MTYYVTAFYDLEKKAKAHSLGVNDYEIAAIAFEKWRAKGLIVTFDEVAAA